MFPDLAKPKLFILSTKLRAQGSGPFSLNGPTFSSKCGKNYWLKKSSL